MHPRFVAGDHQKYPPQSNDKGKPADNNTNANSVVVGGDRASSSSSPSSPPFFKVSLFTVLLAQCALVVAVFVILIVVVTVRMTNATENLIEERITADLKYSRISLVDPLDNAANLLFAHRLRYISMSRELGRSLCSEDDGHFVASRLFWRDALSSVYTHSPFVGWVYTVAQSSKDIHPVTGDRRVVLCTTSVEYMMCDVNGTLRTSNGPVTVDQTDTFEGVEYTEDTTVDTRYDGYVVESLEHTDFGYWPYLWVEPSTNKAHLFIGGFAPMFLNRTLPNGTVETYIPDLTVPKRNKKDRNQTVVSLIAVDLMLPHVHDLLMSINPPHPGAHTSLYDLNAGTLLATTIETVSLMDGNTMYMAGKGSSALLDAAYNMIKPHKGTHGTAENDGRSGSGIRILHHGSSGRVISSVPVTTTSNIDFVIIQSTPAEYYFQEVTMLRSMMIGLGVGSAVAVVVICMVVVVLIRERLAQIQEGMVLAAALKNDRVRPMRSVMTEIDDLCVAFSHMNAKLGAARAFMPQSMLMDSTDDDDHHSDGEEGDVGGDDDQSAKKDVDTFGGDDDESPASSSYTDTSRENSTAVKASKRRRGHAAAAATTATTTTATSGGGGGDGSNLILTAPTAANAPPLLATKKVTILSINARGFHSASLSNNEAGGGGGNGNAASTTVQLATELTRTIQSICAQQRGVIDSFHGDHFVISFNAAKHNAQGPQQAVQCGLDIAAAFAPLPPHPFHPAASSYAGVGNGRGVGGGSAARHMLTSSSAQNNTDNNNNNYNNNDDVAQCTTTSSSFSLYFTMGVASGRAYVGHLGSSDLKRFSIVGKVYTRAMALERVCKQVAEECAERVASTATTITAVKPFTASVDDENNTFPSESSSSPCYRRHDDEASNNNDGGSHQAAKEEETAAPVRADSPPVMLLVEDSLLEILEQSYFLQLVGMMRHGSAVMGGNNNNTQGGRQRQPNDSNNKAAKWTTAGAGAAVFSSASEVTAGLPDNNNNKLNKGSKPVAAGGGGGNGVENRLVYAVRARTIATPESAGDEWLYEVRCEEQTGGRYDSVLPAVNAALARLLLLRQRGRVSATTTSPPTQRFIAANNNTDYDYSPSSLLLTAIHNMNSNEENVNVADPITRSLTTMKEALANGGAASALVAALGPSSPSPSGGAMMLADNDASPTTTTILMSEFKASIFAISAMREEVEANRMKRQQQQGQHAQQQARGEVWGAIALAYAKMVLAEDDMAQPPSWLYYRVY